MNLRVLSQSFAVNVNTSPEPREVVQKNIKEKECAVSEIPSVSTVDQPLYSGKKQKTRGEQFGLNEKYDVQIFETVKADYKIYKFLAKLLNKITGLGFHFENSLNKHDKKIYNRKY